MEQSGSIFNSEKIFKIDLKEKFFRKLKYPLVYNLKHKSLSILKIIS